MNVEVRKDVVRAEVLVIGGGIGGMQAAIAAAEGGADVLVIEKANTKRSGCGATGNDHFMCYLPEYHGDDFDVILQEASETLVGPFSDLNLFALMLSRSFEMIQKWQGYGINMTPTGHWNFEGHAMPNRRRYHLKYDGHNQKVVLTQQAKKRGARIMNHVTMCELLVKDGHICGAVGIDSSKDQPELIVFEAKTVILTTGASARLYPGLNPAFLCNAAGCPSTGGLGAAYRAGAKLVNLDLPYKHAGPSMFARCGKATWIGVLTDMNGKAVGPFGLKRPTRELGDVTSDVWQGVFDEKMASGDGPVYMNCSLTSEEDMIHMRKSFVSEGDTSINDYLDQYGIDLHNEMVEFNTYEFTLCGKGLQINTNAETSIVGLYAAGDNVGNVRGDITSACVFGQIAGEHAAKMVKEREYISVEGNPVIAKAQAECSAIMNRESGAWWMEANSTLNQIMDRYVSVRQVRSETLLKAALYYIRDLKRYAHEQMRANNSHELVRTMEVLDLIDCAEAVALVSENRKESRGFHRRADYPFTSPMYNNKFQTIHLDENGTPVLEFRNRMMNRNYRD